MIKTFVYPVYQALVNEREFLEPGCQSNVCGYNNDSCVYEIFDCSISIKSPVQIPSTCFFKFSQVLLLYLDCLSGQ